ncbi:MAG: DUF342 domain-containing protein [Chitinivibrionales bacterium]|nr:DUF342 domain-containing protein [Chitinivibrionales bacterium]MBD3355785.1 DUF342 domain-containing protein [Chitinivibrionales bacterium]
MERGGIAVSHSPDKLKAYLLVAEERRETYPGLEELRRALAAHGILCGVRDDVLWRMHEKCLCGRRVVVAEGSRPTMGQPGRLKAHIDISSMGTPRKLKDGRVDHKDLQHIHNVQIGQPLFERLPPEPGEPGTTVFGEAIAPPSPGDVPLRSGMGTKTSDENPNLLIAAVEGAVKIGDNGSIEVHAAKLVRGDVDYGTGNISFMGDLRITGTVRAGFEVTVGGDLFVGGSVEDAGIECGGNLEITGGAVGSNMGELVCGGSVKVHHLEGVRVKSRGDVLVVDDAVHSRIEAGGNVRARTIAGGSVIAGEGVRAVVVGATAETKTVLDMAGVYRLQLQRQETLRKMGHHAIELAAQKHAMYLLVRDGMDELGDLRPELGPELLNMRKKRTMLRVEHTRLAKEIERLERKLEDAPRPMIHAGHIYPNVVVRFGPLERTIEEEMDDVCVFADDDDIKIRPIER